MQEIPGGNPESGGCSDPAPTQSAGCDPANGTAMAEGSTSNESVPTERSLGEPNESPALNHNLRSQDSGEHGPLGSRSVAFWTVVAGVTGVAAFAYGVATGGSSPPTLSQSPSSSEMKIAAGVERGFGCTGEGWVFPATSGIGHDIKPGTGPVVASNTWDVSPRSFGALPASPEKLILGVTGPSDHRVTLLEALSRRI